jgi:hypothetical protein
MSNRPIMVAILSNRSLRWSRKLAPVAEGPLALIPAFSPGEKVGELPIFGETRMGLAG